MKNCRKCNAMLIPELQKKDTARKFGYHYICKNCFNAKYRKNIHCKGCNLKFDTFHKRIPEYCSLSCKVKSLTKVLKNGCWISLTETFKKDRPAIRFNYKVISLQRYTYEIVYGKQHHQIRFQQSCSTFHCLEPKHLNVVRTHEIVEKKRKQII